VTEEEIDEIIAEYMETEVWDDVIIIRGGIVSVEHKLYTKSLDALIPVVEKLNKKEQVIFAIECDYDTLAFPDIWHSEYWVEGYGVTHDYRGNESKKSPSLALATACAKVIKDLNETN